MSCWSARSLSWVTIGFHLLLAIIWLILSTVFLCIPQSDYDQEIERNKTFLVALSICLLIYSLLLIGCIIILIVGLKKNRITLFRPYIGTIFLGIGLLVGLTIRMFIKGIRSNEPIGDLALDLLGGLVIAGLFGASFVPVYLHYKKLRSPRCQPEQSGDNQAVDKPYFIQGGQI